MLLVNSPRLIDDRTAYILAVRGGKIATIRPPIRPILAVALSHASASSPRGAEVVGVPCNTAHAPLIFDVVEREVALQPRYQAPTPRAQR